MICPKCSEELLDGSGGCEFCGVVFCYKPKPGKMVGKLPTTTEELDAIAEDLRSIWYRVERIPDVAGLVNGALGRVYNLSEKLKEGEA